MSDTDSKKKEKGVWVTRAQVKLTGSPDAARFLAQCLYWSKLKTVKQRSGWFYKSREEWKAETWLSRFKQEKARTRLKEMHLLQEDRERTNTGIRLWFRINTGLLNALLNNLEQQPVLDQPTVSMDVRSEKKAYKEVNTDIDNIERVSIHRESSDTDDFTETGISSRARGCKTSTIVQGNNTANTAETQSYSLNPDDYVFCHVFIYQFIKTQLNHYPASWHRAFVANGFNDPHILRNLQVFIDDYGAQILDWYQQAMPKIEIPAFTVDDFKLAQIAGRRMYESA